MTKTSLAKVRKTISELKNVEAELMHSDPVRHRLSHCFQFVVQFEIFAGLVYRFRKAPQPQQAVFEDELANAYQSLLALQPRPREQSLYEGWVRAYREAWRSNLSLFAVVGLLFLGSLLIGWFCAVERPEYASLLVGQNMQESIVTNTAWFKQLNHSPLMGGLTIAANNIKVAMLLFAGGCFLGIGGIVLLIYNGISFGSVYGYCYVFHFDRQLFEFVLSHGFLELSILVASAFCGMLVGKVFLVWPVRELSQRAAQAGSVAFAVLLGILPWLVLAATFEAFVSPSPRFTLAFKMTSGIILGLLFWTWTFWPSTAHE